MQLKITEEEILVSAKLQRISNRGKDFTLNLGIELKADNNVFFELNGRDHWISSFKPTTKDRIRIVNTAVEMWYLLRATARQCQLYTLTLTGDIIDKQYCRRLQFYIETIGFCPETLTYKL